MNRGLKIFIVLLIIILGGIGGYFYLKNDANNKAKEFCDEIKIYGYGSDGSVGASKDLLKIIEGLKYA